MHDAQHDELVKIRTALHDAQELTRENNTILKKLHRHAIISTGFRFLTLFVFIGLPIVAYLFAGTILQSIANTLSEEIRTVMQSLLVH